MPNRDILTIGTSAGGVEALLFLAGKMPRGLDAAIFITIHLSSQYRSDLDTILTRAGPLPVGFATDGEPIEKGRIYLAPPARHLLIERDRVALGVGPRENNSRPSIDPMMRSAAVCCGARAIGVVLTGALGDGAAGLWALKRCGGIAVVQDPEDAAFAEMPQTALRRSNADRVVPLAEMPALFQQLVKHPAAPQSLVPEYLKYEVEIAKSGHSSMNGMDRIAKRSPLTCPDCHGIMWEIDETDVVRYRCHLGHAYTEDLMAIALDESLRRSLASGLRAIEERVALVKGMHARASSRGLRTLAQDWARKAAEFEQEAQDVRDTMRRLDVLAQKVRDKDTQAETAAE